MPTPDPATTEWVPLWNTVGSGGGGGSSSIDTEQGYWLPIVGGDAGESGQHYKFQQGWYLRTGKLVTIWSYTQFDSSFTGSPGIINGNVILKGFPFIVGNPPANPVNGGSAPFIAGSVAYYTNMLTPQNITGMTCRSAPTWNYGELFKLRDQGNNPVKMARADLNDAVQLIVSMAFFID
jgi:hypothetical protein